jgi:hypothetical protein
LIEFLAGFNGYLATHEWNFWVFEAALILPVFAIFGALHPARFLSNTGFRLSKARRMPEQEKRFSDRRSDSEPSMA